MDRVIGIDLGTTNSVVSVVEDGNPVVIPNKGGYQTTPSIVAVSEAGKRLVGQIAKRQNITNAENTVYAAKRLIGRKWDTPVVRSAMETCPYKMVEGPLGDVRVELRGRVYSIPEISSFVLQELKMVAEEYLGETIENAVITVPAYFNDGQRQATKDAGRLAGLDVLRIINEPTAAALAYGYGKDIDQRIAVYDLGGGTFDISILTVADGVFEVEATAGDTYLGGEDFDSRVMEWMVFEFAQEQSIDLRKDTMALQRLKDAAEKAKCELSNVEETEINLPFIISSGKADALHLQMTLTREKLEELCADLVARTLKICQRTLNDARLEASDVDAVLLVGGQTRMPMVQRDVGEKFGKPASKGVHPDECVAIGAGIQGASLFEEDSDLLLLDVTPHALGIMIMNGSFDVIIPANSRVPTSKGHIFTTIRANQTAVKIMVFQGDSSRAIENELLGEFVLAGLRAAPAGEVEVEVTFDINADGIVSVSAKDLETGRTQVIEVTATSGLSEEEIQQMMEEHRDYMVDVKSSDDLERKKVDVQRAIGEIEKLMPQVQSALKGLDFGADAIKKAQDVVSQGKDALQSGKSDALSGSAESLNRTLTMFKGIVQRS